MEDLAIEREKQFFDKERIRKILPQSEPILLADTAEVISMKRAVSRVFLNPEWEIFKGHFPSMPVLPGVYVTEAMAQAADLMLLAVPENEGAYPMFFAVSRMRFLRPVYPGDTLRCEAVLAADAGNGMFDCDVAAFCEEKKVAFGRITLALRKI